MQLDKLIKFRKSSRLIRLHRLYLDLLKTKHLLRFFVGGLKHRQLSKLCRIVARRRLFSLFVEVLECRLEVVLLRSGLVSTGNQVRQLILHGHVQVNAVIVTAYQYQLKVGDLISLAREYGESFREQLICNAYRTSAFVAFLKRKGIRKKLRIHQFLNPVWFPGFLEGNYRNLTLCIVRSPHMEEFVFPKVLSSYDCSQLYFLL